MAEYESPEWHPAFEEYAETIFELAEDDFDVIQARIAERLEVPVGTVMSRIHRARTRIKASLSDSGYRAA